TGLRGPLDDPPEMDEQPLALLLRVANLDAESVAGDHALIADLAAGFAIKGRLVDHHRDLVAGRCSLDRGAVPDQRGDHALRGPGRVAEELGRAELLAQLEPYGLGGGLARTLPARARLGLLSLHGGLEARRVDADAALAQRILRQIEREAIGIVELE